MRLDKLTTKLQEALADAQSQAVGNDNQYIEPVHVLLALINQDDGSSHSPFAKGRGECDRLEQCIEGCLERLPKVSGTDGQVQAGRELVGLLNLADKESQKRGDQFLASEMILLALTEDRSEAGKLARENGLTRKALEAAIAAVRGSNNVDSQDARRATRGFKEIHNGPD